MALYLRTMGEPLLKDVVAILIEEKSEAALYVLGLVLQFTDSFNYSILRALVAREPSRDLVTIYRILEAQPYLIKVWDLSWLYQAGDSFLAAYLRLLVNPRNPALAVQLEAVKSIEALEYLDSLRFEKEEERLKQKELNRLFGETPGSKPSRPISGTKEKVLTLYLEEKVA